MKQMNEMNQVLDDEIDLFELFQTLWDGKWLIIAFVAIAVLLGGGSLLLKDAVYNSKLVCSVDTAPPLYKPNKILTDFQKIFYSVNVFDEWKQNNSNTSLVFEDFSATKVVDGFIMSKKEDKQLVTFVFKKKGDLFVLVNSNQLHILDDFFKYATHINGLLTDEYVVRAKKELKVIEERFNNFRDADIGVIKYVLLIDRFISSAEKGASVLNIQRPTMPKKVSPKFSPILTMSVFIGGMFGVFFIFLRFAIAKRKEQSAKA
jgi:capsular polysaccharide biosynthesis protein